MKLLRFLFSLSFLKQLFLAGVAVLTMGFLFLYAVQIHTRHNHFKVVPELSKIPLDQAVQLLALNALRYEVIDSANYNPNYVPFAVIEQLPLAGEKVKEDRIIYLTVNPSNYRSVSLPDIIQITLRNAESTLRSVGLDIGEITYRDNIGKNMVLQMRYDGAPIVAGSKVPKTSQIDLVLGNGKRETE